MIIAANWKMNLNRAEAETHLRITAQHSIHQRDSVQSVLFLPACYWQMADERIGKDSNVQWGGQDCHAQNAGAFTGDVSAEMLASFNADWVLVGHSERRRDHMEDDLLIAQKAGQALKSGLRVMLCVGESEAQREQNQHFDLIETQLKVVFDDLKTKGGQIQDVVIAYEPVWAIGTGKVATSEQIAEMHIHIKNALSSYMPSDMSVPVLYGGSVNKSNAAEIFALPAVNGALVGGASLDAEGFAQLCALAAVK